MGVIVASAFSMLIKAFTHFGISPMIAAARVQTCPACRSDELPLAAPRCRCCGIEPTRRHRPQPAMACRSPPRVVGPSRRSLSVRR